MPHIIPIKDLKDTAKISEMCHKSSEPIYVTKNGYGDMVLMSMEAFEEMIQKEKLYCELEISENQIKAGKTRDAWEALAEVKEKYGL
ncbi:MAG: type II toxin-antitoxin system Phd/YefM family antitoxin [Eubacteriaceae bacterium]|jgi:PHD/YefM family antitoxin component YafN of YafNO toxin-antitoxin module|uniref:Antitoxin n=1 Tax=Candidatus Pseudoramibacter fermentans TaxID=2594427 RepID=A0A6L5GTU5_9FIRM|nr:type II toxin-antitoxin system Phd/YefM family antitoxin [Candidatus Pseudoramibacter fermentans]RRF92704.1 MAG: type II toxin-antitoxin system Phd/YefM family antitoxin [Eubacteriaceae bacterium]